MKCFGQLLISAFEHLQSKSEKIYNLKTVTKKSLHVNNTRGKPSTYIFSLNFKTSVFKDIIYTL